jgi:hypothetical protein
MAGDSQHHMPATVIAGFGRRSAGPRRRDSEIFVRDLANGTITLNLAAKSSGEEATP